MARLSDIIEDFIKEMFNENRDNVIFIQRNELADQFRCAPSQINYVLTTRFTYERGYLIESKSEKSKSENSNSEKSKRRKRKNNEKGYGRIFPEYPVQIDRIISHSGILHCCSWCGIL